MITHQRRRAAGADAAPPSTTASPRITWAGTAHAPRQERTAFPPTSWSSGGRSHHCPVADRLRGVSCVEELAGAHPDTLKAHHGLTDEDLEVLAAWLAYWGHGVAWRERVLEARLAAAEARIAELEGVSS